MAESKMIQRVVRGAVAVQRDKKNVYPEIGKPFDFTQEEIDYFETAAPDSLAPVLVEAEESKPESKRKKGGSGSDEL